MEQTIKAYFNSIPLDTAEFTSILGVSPGSGTISSPMISNFFPKEGTLLLKDGATSISLKEMFTDKPRRVNNAISGERLVATIYDRRYLWRWGHITGMYNPIQADGLPRKDKNLQELMALCFEALEETNYQLIGIPKDIYPTIKWEYENPGNALSELCEKYELVIGISSSGNNSIIITSYKYKINIPIKPSTETMITVEGDILPRSIVVVGGRKVVQMTFLNLIPVGEDTDGTIKKINDLSYAPAGVGEEAYPDELWGKETIAMFANLDNDQARQLANKCIFKWFTIDWDIYDINLVLPLLGYLSEIVTVGGVEEHDKPHILRSKTVWDKQTFKTLAKQRITEGVTFDKNLGIVKLSSRDDGIISKTADSVKSDGFIRSVMDLVAAFEMKTNTYEDFVYWTKEVAGGKHIPVVYRDKKLIEFFKYNVTSEKWDSLNVKKLKTHVDKIMSKLAEKYISTNPRIYTFAGVARIHAAGIIKSVTWRLDDSGAETVVQEGIELPMRQLPTYEERLSKRKLTFLLSDSK